MLSSEEASTQNRCEKLTRNKSSVIYKKVGILLLRYSLYELETNLSLSNSSHSPEET
jgi:chaperonin cofactor prefoldin